MTVEDEGRLIAIFAVLLILAFVGGLIAAFATADWRWLVLPLISGAMILGNVRRG